MENGITQNSKIRFIDQPTNATKTTSGKGTLGKDDFFKLMMEQLKYQDPMNPMEGSEYAAQLAQFSSVEQLTNLNKAMDTSINASYQLAQSVNNTMSTNLIGKEVKLTTSTVLYDGQEKLPLAYELKADAKYARLKIKDAKGNLVKTIDLKDTKAGTYRTEWDFTNNAGKLVEKGNYKFELETKGLNDKDIVAKTYQLGSVEAIRFTEQGAVVVIQGKQYALADVYEIVNPK